MTDKQPTLRVVGVEIKSFLGLREFSFEPGRVTEISGRNGEGKTSTLSALQAALGGGNLANLRNLAGSDEDAPEVVLVLEGEGDSNECYRIEKRGDARTKVLARVGDSAAFEDLKRPEEWIRALSDRGCSFPLRWLEAADKDQVHMLLEALPIKFDEVAFLQEVGVQKSELAPIPKGLHPLEHVALIRESVYNARTGVNRDQKAKAESAQQLKRDAPARLSVQDEQEIAILEGKLVALAEENAKAEANISAEHARQEEAVRSAFKRDAAKMRTDFESWVAKERAKVEEQIAARKEEDEKLLDEVDDERDKQRAALTAKKDEQAAAQERLATLRERSKNSIKAKALLEKAEEFERDASDLTEKSKALTAAIEKIDGLKAEMAREIPIEGLEVRDGAVFIGKVPIRQVNRAQQFRIAIQVALLRANPRLPVIFVDDAEKLDSENYRLFVEEVKKSGAQLFTARVTNEPFALTTVPFGK